MNARDTSYRIRDALLQCGVGLIVGLGVVWLIARWDLQIALAFAESPSEAFGAFMHDWGRSPLTALLVSGGYILASKPDRLKHPLLSQLAAALVAQVILHAALATNLIKLLVGRPRPLTLGLDGAGFVSWLSLNPGVGDFSFPSGHVAITMTLAPCVILLWRAGRRGASAGVAAAMLAWCGLMAYGRVAYQAHFLSDVTASICLGLAIAPLSAWIGLRVMRGARGSAGS